MKINELSPEAKDALSIVREQVENGDFLTHREVDEKIKSLFYKWEN